MGSDQEIRENETVRVKTQRRGEDMVFAVREIRMYDSGASE